MRRFSTEEMLLIMSEEHRLNTGWALQKPAHEVTNLDLIVHWLEHHVVPVIHFNVEPERKSPHGEDELAVFI